MEFALSGFVDDQAINFVTHHGASVFYEIQVKSIRKSKYVFQSSLCWSFLIEATNESGTNRGAL
jgi:hypothetical protein